MWERFTKFAALAGGAIAGLFGQWTALMTFLVVAMSVDILSGWFVAMSGKSPKSCDGNLSSSAGFRGLLKKGGIVLVVLVATMLDRTIGSDIMIFQTATVCYYIANELLSVIENVRTLGLPIPAAIQKALNSLKAKNDEMPTLPDTDDTPSANADTDARA